jgi:hypothetical protein
MRTGLIALCAMAAAAAALSAEGETAKPADGPPCLIYRPADRAAIRKRLHLEDGKWQPAAEPQTQDPASKLLLEAWQRGYEKPLKRQGTSAEGGEAGSYGRSNAMLDLALLAWLEPSLARPGKPEADCATILDCVLTGVKRITIPK